MTVATGDDKCECGDECECEKEKCGCGGECGCGKEQCDCNGKCGDTGNGSQE